MGRRLFFLETLSRAVLIPDGLDIRADLSDGLHALAAGLSLCGAVSLGDARFPAAC